MIDNLNNALQDEADYFGSIIQELQEQNNHYRERLEYLLAEAKDHKEKGLRIQHWALIKDLENALEELE